MNNCNIGIFDSYDKAVLERIRYLRHAGLDENGKHFDAEIVNPRSIRKFERVDIDVDSIPPEAVNVDAALTFGSFGAVHEEPEPVTSWELAIASYEDSFYYGE
jgi:hypothetical protein